MAVAATCWPASRWPCWTRRVSWRLHGAWREGATGGAGGSRDGAVWAPRAPAGRGGAAGRRAARPRGHRAGLARSPPSARRRLRVLAGRRPGAPRSPLPPPAPRRRRAVPDGRPRTPSPGPTPTGRVPTCPCGALRAARRDVLAGGHLRRRGRPTSTTSSTWASTPSSSCRWPSSPGERGWGYDGVAPVGAARRLRRPDGLRRLVDACHARGLGVCSTSSTTTSARPGTTWPSSVRTSPTATTTNWGDAVNLDGRAATRCGPSWSTTPCMWLRDYHLDGLRLDAVHAIVDESAVHLLEQLADARWSWRRRAGPAAVADRRERPQRPRFVRPAEAGGYGLDAAVGRRVAPRPARRAHRRARRLLRRLRPARRPGQGAAPGVGLRRHRSPHRGGPTAARRRPARRPVRGQRPEPRPGRQPGRGASGSAHLVAPGPRVRIAAALLLTRRSCRCCSRARSGRRRRRSTRGGLRGRGDHRPQHQDPPSGGGGGEGGREAWGYGAGPPAPPLGGWTRR